MTARGRFEFPLVLNTVDVVNDEREWMRVALHDLCQPLTALECCLHVSTMEIDGELPAPEELRHTIRAAIAECERMMSRVRAMQERLHYGDRGYEDRGQIEQ